MISSNLTAVSREIQNRFASLVGSHLPSTSGATEFNEATRNPLHRHLNQFEFRNLLKDHLVSVHAESHLGKVNLLLA